ncbi:hypothetical protein PGTUg99_011863 [Puccinia graminis f. sp. tritici]|uniref:Uncharacterized protein n=1 Tax=Puccinia graminis f. sp. tritici TaxID=56615 RepID=A0A5B0RZA1_PUCGR|nr:hypothetical protein PGTUg99_011863 [Puccinia graminis f. sp. tritici]
MKKKEYEETGLFIPAVSNLFVSFKFELLDGGIEFWNGPTRKFSLLKRNGQPSVIQAHKLPHHKPRQSPTQCRNQDLGQFLSTSDNQKFNNGQTGISFNSDSGLGQACEFQSSQLDSELDSEWVVSLRLSNNPPRSGTCSKKPRGLPRAFGTL